MSAPESIPAKLVLMPACVKKKASASDTLKVVLTSDSDCNAGRICMPDACLADDFIGQT
ncbi:hypothetical protein ACO0LH_16855 [Undibacterium sp. TJN19]